MNNSLYLYIVGFYICCGSLFWYIAQLVEQLTVNQKVCRFESYCASYSSLFSTTKNRGNKNERCEICLIQISKKEAIKLNKEYGVNYGENGISHTRSCHNKRKTYYMCKSYKNMDALNKLRNK